MAKGKVNITVKAKMEPATEREVFSLAYSRKKKIIRAIYRGRAHYLKLYQLAEAAVLCLVTAGLFAMAKHHAATVRGYEAIGGEYLLLALPFLYYTIRETVVGLIRDYKAAKRESDRREQAASDAFFVPPPGTQKISTAQLAAATNALSKAWAEVGVSAEELASAFGELAERAAAKEGPAPLKIAFVARTLSAADILFRQFRLDNELYIKRMTPTGRVYTMPDYTEITVMGASTPPCFSRGRRYDQAIIVTDHHGSLLQEFSEFIESLEERATGRVPEEFFFQFYNADAEAPYE